MNIKETLKEKMLEAIKKEDSEKLSYVTTLSDGELDRAIDVIAELTEKQRDEFTIEFAEWIKEAKYYTTESGQWTKGWKKDGALYENYTSELLSIFKQSNGA